MRRVKGVKIMKLNLTLHDAKKELPKKSCEVIAFQCIERGGVYNISNVGYSHKYKKFNCYDFMSKEEADSGSYEVAYWAEMPKRLKAVKL